MKKRILTTFLAGILCLTLFLPAGCGNVSRYFDLSDEKVLWSDEIPAGTRLDRVYVILKKTSIYPKLHKSSFGIKQIKKIEYLQFKPDQNKSNDIDYIENFRQEIYVTLELESFSLNENITFNENYETLNEIKEKQREEFLEVLHKLDKLNFVKRLLWRVPLTVRGVNYVKKDKTIYKE